MILGQKILRYPTLDSTNDEAKRLIAAGEGEGLVVVAETQTAGRGKPGRSWVSPAGGLYMSAVVEPYKNANNLPELTLVAARAVVAAIKQLTGLAATIKQPNDVLVQGQKVCGILTELRGTKVIIGIGLNLVAQPEYAALPGGLSVAAVLPQLLKELEVQYLAYLG